MKNKILLIFFICFVHCSGPEKDDPQAVVDKTIAVSGTANLSLAELEFTFRGRKYEAKFNNGFFEYVRHSDNDSLNYKDVLTNEGFHRQLNGREVPVPDTMAAKYSNSINSVIYFALLPRGLNDQAVNKEYLGTKKLKDSIYHKIKITFDQDGGGKDYEDEFIYWINQKSFKIDYLAYSFHTDGGGMRFRSAYNERYIEGVRFVDYVNYKPVQALSLTDIDAAFVNGQLEPISKIELKDVQVRRKL